MRTPSSSAIAQRLVSNFREALEKGEWAAGEPLPSSRDLAEKYKASPSAVHRALTQLKKESLVTTTPRRWIVCEKNALPGLKIGRGLSSLQGKQIAFCMLDNPIVGRFMDQPETWTSTILSSLTESLADHGLSLTLIVDRDCGKPDVLPETTVRRLSAMSETLAGVVMFRENPLSPFRQWLDREKVPYVCIGRDNGRETSNFVSTDVDEIGRLAAFIASAANISNIWYISGSPKLFFAERQQLHAFCGAYLEASGSMLREFRHFVAQNNQEINGYEMVAAALQNHQPPQMIFSGGDYLALGAVRAVQEHGLRCPEDVRVLGGNGLDFSAFVQPHLSTINQPMKQVGKEVASLLIEMAQTKRFSYPGRILPISISLRETFPATAAITAMLHKEFPALHLESSNNKPGGESPSSPLASHASSAGETK